MGKAGSTILDTNDRFPDLTLEMVSLFDLTTP